MSKKTLIIVGVIISSIILIGIGSSASRNENNQIVIQPTQAVKPTEAPAPAYKVVYNEDNGSVVNIYALIDPTATSEATAKSIAFDVKKKVCGDNKCNIDLFDDSSALEIQHQYISNTFTPQENDAWARKNYVFVANHYVGDITFDLPNDFDYYFLKKDVEYQKYKNL